VRLLLERGADVNVKGSYRETALHQAIWSAHEAVARLLVEKGADVNAKNGEVKVTALHRAAGMGLDALVQLLLDHKAATDAAKSDGMTALFRAVMNGEEAVVRFPRAWG